MRSPRRLVLEARFAVGATGQMRKKSRLPILRDDSQEEIQANMLIQVLGASAIRIVIQKHLSPPLRETRGLASVYGRVIDYLLNADRRPF